MTTLEARLAFALATGIVLPEHGPLPAGAESMYKDMFNLAVDLNLKGTSWTIGDLARAYLMSQLNKAVDRLKD